MALFRMKLHSVHIVVLEHRDELAAVVGGGQHVAGNRADQVVRVAEIKS